MMNPGKEGKGESEEPTSPYIAQIYPLKDFFISWCHLHHLPPFSHPQHRRHLTHACCFGHGLTARSVGHVPGSDSLRRTV